jgi:hypothetical protein
MTGESTSDYDRLTEYATKRDLEIRQWLSDYVQVTDDYGLLFCRLTALLGSTPPTDDLDRVTRDLMADVFDFLFDSRAAILRGQLTIAYPLARRAYESLSLLALCRVDPSFAAKWNDGKRIENAEVRKQLAKYEMGEQEDKTRELYRFFSEAAHPNRSLVPSRLLGEGNVFVLGAIGLPPEALTLDYAIKHLGLWFWLAATVSFAYVDITKRLDHSYGDEYLRVAARAKVVAKDLVHEYNNAVDRLASL